MTTEITSSVQLAARLTDLLYKGTYISSDSAQALFDVLADALAARPDIVASVAKELADRDEQARKYDAEQQRKWYADITTRLMALEQHINEGHNVD